MFLPKVQRHGPHYQTIIHVHPVVHPNVDLKRYPREVPVAKWKLKKVGSIDLGYTIAHRKTNREREGGREEKQTKQTVSFFWLIPIDSHIAKVNGTL